MSKRTNKTALAEPTANLLASAFARVPNGDPITGRPVEVVPDPHGNRAQRRAAARLGVQEVGR